jgi:hypothetical protein
VSQGRIADALDAVREALAVLAAAGDMPGSEELHDAVALAATVLLGAEAALVVHPLDHLLPHADYAARAATERQITHLHSLGPRPVGEALAELGIAEGITPAIRGVLARYWRLPRETVVAFGADRWPVAPSRALP